MMGFEALTQGGDADTAPFTRPAPLLAQGRVLAPHVSAMMDVSDGLLLDAWRMAEASSVSFSLDSAAVPLAAPETRRADALRWGDDYALLFTAPQGTDLPIDATMIGTVERRSTSPVLLDGAALSTKDELGYRH